MNAEAEFEKWWNDRVICHQQDYKWEHKYDAARDAFLEGFRLAQALVVPCGDAPPTSSGE